MKFCTRRFRGNAEAVPTRSAAKEHEVCCAGRDDYLRGNYHGVGWLTGAVKSRPAGPSRLVTEMATKVTDATFCTHSASMLVYAAPKGANGQDVANMA